jgi:rubredoxin
MERYKCSVCGYIYNPEDGDPSSGIEPGTPFSNLPDGYICPLCAAGKDEFFVSD